MSKRQGISKSTRFEIFKRDGFACQYCGAHPPSVVLEVDHITPVAGGGDNDMDNLVTACFNCNRGKSATPLDSVPQSLADKATEVAEREAQLLGYNSILQARRERIEQQLWEVVETLTDKQECSHSEFTSVKRFIERLGFHECLEAAEITRGANVRSERSRFLYFFKVCWNKVTALEAGQ